MDSAQVSSPHTPKLLPRVLGAMLIFVVLAAALLVRVINAGADPPSSISRDFITDEGQWTHNARNAAIYGQWRLDDYNPGFHSAFLYTCLVYSITEAGPLSRDCGVVDPSVGC